jgi:hypothetical protein
VGSAPDRGGCGDPAAAIVEQIEIIRPGMLGRVWSNSTAIGEVKQSVGVMPIVLDEPTGFIRF